MTTMDGRGDEPDPPQGFSPAGQLLNLITGYWISQAIQVAAELGIADHLGRRGRPVDELARATGAHAPSLYRLLRALASVGIFAEVKPCEFALTPMGALLRSDMPGNLREFSRFQGLAWHWGCWGAIGESVRTGAPATDCFEYLAGHPDALATFNAAMSGYAQQVHAAVVDVYDFSAARLVVDVGGGQGALLASILAGYPQAEGIVFDRGEVVAGAPQVFTQYGLERRCRAVSGNFFDAVPAGGDVYLLCAVIHDWDDPKAVTILRRVSEAMPEQACLLIVENVIPTDGEAHPGKWIDLEMLVMTGGRERTAAEFGVLTAAAGLCIDRILPTAVSVSVIEVRSAATGAAGPRAAS